jgi:tRNA modification GTPase
MNTSTDTIAALATPHGEGGLAVVRLSGEDAISILTSFYRTTTGDSRSDWEHRRLYHGTLVDKSGEPVDDAMFAVMKAPESYTGEHTVEISCHGGPVVVARVLRTMFAAGARPAEAGEFTKRAFLNGKMDLIQAEAVADLIHARSELQQVAAHRQLSGGLSSQIGALADEVLELLGIIEANIDFIEDDIDTFDVGEAIALIDRQRATLADMLASTTFTRPFRDGYDVVLAGPVNAGKSSLFNRLAGEQRAIVTAIAGTTRDVIRETMTISGALFTLNDTAGLRDDAGDEVEAIGMGLTNAAIENADVVVCVLDGRAPLPDGGDRWLQTLNPEKTIVALNKTDLPDSSDAFNIVGLPAGLRNIGVSAKTGDGIDHLRAAIFELAGGENVVRLAKERAVLNARVEELLADAAAKLGGLRETLAESKELEVLAVDVRGILGCYESATGRRFEEGLLDVIFSRFCIGK